MKLKLAYIGFGVVGQGLAEILLSKRKELRERHALDIEVVAIADAVRGSIYDPAGLDLAAVLRTVAEGRKLDELRASAKGWDAIRTARETNADIVVEVTPTNIRTGEPALSHVRAALETGKHVVTTNKGPVVKAFRSIQALARRQRVQFRCEGTVMSGTPVLDLAERCLAGCRIDAIRGILNGTTNFILTEMETGIPYAEALAHAQKLGYAEAQPDADVLGWDALGKVVILADLVMGADLTIDQVQCVGITGLDTAQVQAARAEGQCWKLIAEVRRTAEGIQAHVGPQRIDATDPLAAIRGAMNALTFSTDLLGDVTIVGAGAGKLETGFALLSDIREISRGK